MKFVALISGGKDSCFNILHCLKQGHELVALANLYPIDATEQELNSFMFQTVGHDIVSLYDKCTGMPLYRQPIKPDSSKNVELNYTRTENDEIEDLFLLLSKVKSEIPDLGGVSVGAILSSYQRTRVEDVCARLNLVSLSYLWQRDQLDLMTEMCSISKQDPEKDDGNMDARIIKVAAIGLDESSLNKSLPQIFPVLKKLNERYDVHICGEGGEFETMVVDAPFFSNGRLKVISHNPDLSDSHDGVYSTRLEIEFEEAKRDLNLQNQLEDLPTPPLLNEKWMDLLEVLKQQHDSVQHSIKMPPITSDADKALNKISISRLGNIQFISNIKPRNFFATVQEQANDVFHQLGAILSERGLNPSQGLFCSLSLSDMSNFAHINKIYSNFFSIKRYGPLPPARACVGSSFLGKGCFLQLSVMLDVSCPNPVEGPFTGQIKKNGLHVQGRSYWAPCNIGPYSQAIWLSDDPNKVSCISGQIALEPSSMDMIATESDLQSVTSLRHFDTIKTTIDAKRQLFMTCFVVHDSTISSVKRTWALYCQDMSYESDNWSDKQNDSSECLIILKVSQLPRGALCEWGGVTCKELSCETLGYDYDDDDQENEKISPQIHAKKPDNLSLFKDISVTNKHSDRHFITGFENSLAELVVFLKNITANFRATLYCNPSKVIEPQKVLDEFTNIEYYPVEEVFDHEGTPHVFGYHIMI